MKLINVSNTSKRYAVTFLIIVLIIGILGTCYIFRTRSTKLAGITLIPSRDFPVADIPYYLQNDPKWSTDKIGNTTSTMGSTGCLITCVAVSLNHLGVEVTPQELNQALTEINGYQGADLIWYKINEAYSSVDYSYGRTFSSDTIENDLESGRLPIVNVRINGVATHWAMIVGAADGDFLIFDPLNKDKMPIPLKKYGKVYAYRVLHKAGEL